MRQREVGRDVGECWRGREKTAGGMIGRKGGPLVAYVFIYVCLLYLSTVFLSPKTGKIVFSPPAVTLSGDDHLLLSVPHKQPRQDLAHGGVQKTPTGYLQHAYFYHETPSPVVLVIGLQNNLLASSICSARNQEQ